MSENVACGDGRKSPEAKAKARETRRRRPIGELKTEAAALAAHMTNSERDDVRELGEIVGLIGVVVTRAEMTDEERRTVVALKHALRAFYAVRSCMPQAKGHMIGLLHDAVFELSRAVDAHDLANFMPDNVISFAAERAKRRPQTEEE